MKRAIITFLLLSVLSVMLTGCMMGEVVEVDVTVKNSTDYEIGMIVFNIGQSSGSYSPMNYIINEGDDPLQPEEERTVAISFVDSDFGNSGGANVEIFDGGDYGELETAIGNVALERENNYFEITHDGEKFVFTPVEDAESK